ncbi:hypothetical protein BDR26DRAFT_853677 [Obelidium mucronatum]|nr:hypothetical protein BDR26DRAFT_853677 [Obelidium mucronatum]
MAIIIQVVHKYEGSIVKLAGDASEEGGEEEEQEENQDDFSGRNTLCANVMCCCLELLLHFQNYYVEIGHNNEKRALKIHIGLGLGSVDHIHIGTNNADASNGLSSVRRGSNLNHQSLQYGRREYFIAGNALLIAGECLNMGKQGEMGKMLTSDCFCLGEPDALLEFQKQLSTYLLKGSKRPRSGTKLEKNLPANDYNFGLSASYMDDSISKSVLSSTMHQHLPELDQLRAVSVVFIKFTDFHSESVAQPENLKKLNSSMSIIVRAIQSYEGCIRQFNCDDKSLTALLGECELAVQAAIDIANGLTKVLGSGFAIGVTTGVVFSGIVGCAERCDSTVLGVAVNTAARLMSLDICHGRIICDEETYLKVTDIASFDLNVPVLSLKGSPHPVKVYPVISRLNRTMPRKSLQPAVPIAGREEEIVILQSALEVWRNGKKIEASNICQNTMIVGPSGIGKSQLISWFEAKALNSEILCTGIAQEHKKESCLFVWSQILLSFLDQIDSSVLSTFMHRRRSDRRGALKYRLRNLPNSSSILESASGLAPPGSLGKSHTSLLSIQSSGSKLRDNPHSALLLELFRAIELPSFHLITLSVIPGIIEIAEKPDINDVITKLTFVLANIFNACCDAGLKLSIVLDDVQWCDSYSLQLTLGIIQHCPKLCFLIGSRPVEEWRLSMQEYFQQISATNVNLINLQPLTDQGLESLLKSNITSLTFATISKDLIQTIQKRSQGSPLVASVVISSWIEEDMLQVIEGVLNIKITSARISSGPSGLSGVVIAQFDKLPLQMKSILRVAAISGQYFALEDISEVLTLSQCEESVGDTPPSLELILNIITACDKYKFLKNTNNEGILSFSHYLIQQGVLATMVPAKREKIHELFATIYEERLTNPALDYNEKEGLRQLLICHLMEVSGHETTKAIQLYQAFIEAAEKRRVVEALEYYNMFSSLPTHPTAELNILVKIKEIRLLIQIFFEKREYAKCINLSREALRILGCKKSIYSPGLFGILSNIFKLSGVARRVIKLEREKFMQELQHFYKNVYPNAQNLKIDAATGDIENEMLTEIRDILYMTVSAHQHYNPGPEVFLLILIDLIAPLKKGNTDLRIATYSSALAIGSAFMGFLNLSEEASKQSDDYLAKIEANPIMEESMSPAEAEDYAVVLESSSYTHQLYGHHTYAGSCQIKAHGVLVAYGHGYSEKAFYIARNRQHSLYYCGEFQEMVEQWETTSELYANARDPYTLADARIAVAAALCQLDLYDQAIAIYREYYSCLDFDKVQGCEKNNLLAGYLYLFHISICETIRTGTVSVHMLSHLNNIFWCISKITLRVFLSSAAFLLNTIISELLIETYKEASWVKSQEFSEIKVTIARLLKFLSKMIVFPEFPIWPFHRQLSKAVIGLCNGRHGKFVLDAKKYVKTIPPNLAPDRHLMIVKSKIWQVKGVGLIADTQKRNSKNFELWDSEGKEIRTSLETEGLKWELILFDGARNWVFSENK